MRVRSEDITLNMKYLEYCPKCGNSHEGSCSTEAVYFYWFPQNKYCLPQEVSICGDWSRWQRKQKMNKVTPSSGNSYFSILLALSEGTHLYKYIVDGTWTHDPSVPTVPNEFGSLNNIAEILPKKSYTKKESGQSVKLTSNYYCFQGLKIIGSWDNWAQEHLMTLTYNPLKKIHQYQIELDLKATNTYQFIFKHKQQYLVDQKYPTVTNQFGTLNNFTIVYANKIRSDTPRNVQASPRPLSGAERERPAKEIKGNVFSWRKVGQKVKLPYQRIQGHTICCVGEYIYIFGGKSRSEYINTLIKINSSFDKLQYLDAVPDGRASHQMKVYGNKILVYGGNNQDILDDYNVFNVSDNRWQNPQKIPKSKVNKWERHSCVLYESLLVFFGGCYSAQNIEIQQLSDQIEVLDLEKMSWVESIKLDGEHPRPRFAHAADLLKSHMYIFGGVTDIPTNTKANDLWKINLMNVNSMQWIQVKPKGTPPQPRHGHTLNALKNLLIVFGGVSQRQEYLNDVGIYNSLTNQWMVPYVQGSIPIARYNHASANLFNNSIVIFGGKTQDRGKNNQIYLLEPGFSKQLRLFDEEDSDTE